jgi:hypothetical protein
MNCRESDPGVRLLALFSIEHIFIILFVASLVYLHPYFSEQNPDLSYLCITDTSHHCHDLVEGISVFCGSRLYQCLGFMHFIVVKTKEPPGQNAYGRYCAAQYFSSPAQCI